LLLVRGGQRQQVGRDFLQLDGADSGDAKQIARNQEWSVAVARFDNAAGQGLSDARQQG
jgi:hypothetical protein